MKVRVKDWYDMARAFSIAKDGDVNCYCCFTTFMKEYCGKIIEVDRDKVSAIKGVFEYDDWTFSDDMYEVIEE